MIPKFDRTTGYLPAGIHRASWREVEKHFGFSSKRQLLLEGLLRACRIFRGAGVKVMFLDGSFVTSHREPDDYDCCYDTAGVNPDLIDPVLLEIEGKRLAMKDIYFGEFLPAEWPVETQIHFGTILSWFQQDGDARPRGIIALDLATLP